MSQATMEEAHCQSCGELCDEVNRLRHKVRTGKRMRLGELSYCRTCASEKYDGLTPMPHITARGKQYWTT